MLPGLAPLSPLAPSAACALLRVLNAVTARSPALFAALHSSAPSPQQPALAAAPSLATGLPLHSAAAPAYTPRSSWWTVTPDERLEVPAEPHEERLDFAFSSSHPSQRFAHMLTQLRTRYPPSVWDKVEGLFPERHHHRPACVNIAIGAEGRTGVELAKRSFHVVGVEGDPQLLARTFHFAEAQHAPLQLITARAEASLLHDGCADLVTFMHGLHLVDTPRALAEAHRLARPGGKLVAAWNDRDLSSPFVSELEGLFERYNPAYLRGSKQRGLEQWGARIQEGGLFRLLEYSEHANPLHVRNAVALLDVLDCMSFVRGALHGSARRAFNADVRALCDAHHGRRSFELPLTTKLYVLEKVGGGEPHPAKLKFKPSNGGGLFCG